MAYRLRERFRAPIVALGLALGLACGLALAIAPALAQGGATTIIRGTVNRTDSGGMMPMFLDVKTRDGKSADVYFGEGLVVLPVMAAALSDIVVGAIVSVAARTTGAGLEAIAVEVHPDAAGLAPGQRPWDLVGDSTLTVGMVSAAADRDGGKAVTIAYDGGQQDIFIPAAAALYTTGAPAMLSALEPGAALFMETAKGGDGMVRTSRILVEANGVKPAL